MLTCSDSLAYMCVRVQTSLWLGTACALMQQLLRSRPSRPCEGHVPVPLAIQNGWVSHAVMGTAGLC